MILVDGVPVNNGGGLILLKDLINKINTEEEVFFLLDKRCAHEFPFLTGNVKFISNSLFERFKFYYSNKNKFSKVLCFGNVPPPIRLKATVYVYFHQALFLIIPDNFNFFKKIVYFLKKSVIYYFRNNTDYWLVQSSSMKKSLSHIYLNNKLDKIIEVPFYPELNFSEISIHRQLGGLLYVSNSAPHKNHYKLIDAFCLSYDLIKKGYLTLTVPLNDSELCNYIQKKIDLGYPIFNLGFIQRSNLAEVYLSHQYLIYPSLSESFGLGLAEAIDGGCKVISSDLPYTYEVCKPSLVFDPNCIESIKLSIQRALNEELPSSQKLINNDISKLINFLVE